MKSSEIFNIYTTVLRSEIIKNIEISKENFVYFIILPIGKVALLKTFALHMINSLQNRHCALSNENIFIQSL